MMNSLRLRLLPVAMDDASRVERLTTIRERLFVRPSLLEAFAVLFSIGLSLGIMYIHYYVDGFVNPWDFQFFYNTVAGDYDGFFYMQWAIFLFYPFAALKNFWLAYILWNLVNTLGILFAARVFGGRAGIVLLSYQTFFNIYYGQITGVIVFGLAWYWWLMLQRKPMLAGVGVIIALVKPQLGFPLLLAMGMVSDDKWRNRIVSALPVFGILVVSFLVFGNWHLELLERLRSTPPSTLGSITLWEYIGAISLVLWIPAIFLPMDADSRLMMVAATSSLATPYYQHTGLISLWVLPVGLLPLLGNLGFLSAWRGFAALEWLAIVPLMVYIWVLYRSLNRLR